MGEGDEEGTRREDGTCPGLGSSTTWLRLPWEKETKQVGYATMAYATQKSVSLMLMDFLPLAMLEAGGDHRSSIMVIGVYQISISFTSFFSSRLFHQMGRRGGYLVSAVFFLLGSTLGVISLESKNASMIAGSVVLFGFAIGVAGSIRFAAMEVCKPDKRSKDQALTVVMSGGILSAAFGPLTTPAFALMIKGHKFVGCYITIFLIIAVNLWLVAFMIQFPPPSARKANNNPIKMNTSGLPVAATHHNAPDRTTILALEKGEKVERFLLAVASSTWGNTILMLVMSSVLSEMVYGRDFSLFESSVSVFMCFMGRFLPGPISGSFMKDYGIYLGQFFANTCFIVAIIVFWTGNNLESFILGMTFTGLGWHFSFAGGSLLLGRVKSGKGNKKKLKYQSLHDFCVFFTSGLVVILSSLGDPDWHTQLIIIFVVAMLSLLTSLVTYYYGFNTREAAERDSISYENENVIEQDIVVNPMRESSSTTEEWVNNEDKASVDAPQATL